MRFFFVVLVSLLPFIMFFSTNLLPHTHDGFVHLARLGAYFKALGDGQIPVRWAADLNYGYGLPLFNFIYHTPYLVGSLLIFMGAGMVSSFKIILALSFILSGIFMFGFTLSFFNDHRKALLATFFYQFATFRLVEILARGSFGEVYAYAFFPLALWGIVNLFKKITYSSILITVLGTAFLIVSHNAISLVFFVVVSCFALIFSTKTRDYVATLGSLFLGLALSSFYWIPAIFEHKYTYGDLFMKNLYLSHFPPIQNFFIPNFFDFLSLQTGGISVQFGFFHTLAIIAALFVLIKKKNLDVKTKKLIIFCFALLFIALFLMQPISNFVWSNVSWLRQFQFSWRFLSVVVFATSMLSVSFLYFKFFNKRIVYFGLLFLVIASSAYYWRLSLGIDKIDENYYWNFPLNTTYFGETDVIWSAGPKSGYPKQSIEIIGGEGEILHIKRKSNIHEFAVDAKTEIQLVDHTQYFPGWRVFVDGRQIPIEFQDQNWRGEITFYVPKGKHDIRVVFGETKIRLMADIVSLLTLFGIVAVFFRFIKVSPSRR